MERPLEQSLFVNTEFSLKIQHFQPVQHWKQTEMELELPLLTVDSTVKRALADGNLHLISLSFYSPWGLGAHGQPLASHLETEDTCLADK